VKNRAGASSPEVQKSSQPLPEKPVAAQLPPSLPASPATPAPPTAALPATPEAKSSVTVSSVKPAANLQERLISAGSLSQATAFTNLLKCWGIAPNLQAGLNEIPSEIQDDMTFFSLVARQTGLTVTAVDQDLSRLVALNVPAILKLNHPLDHHPVYVILVKASSDAMTLILDETGQTAEVPIPEIMGTWSGSAFVFWKNFYNYKGMIAFSAPEEAIIALKLHLRAMGNKDININGIFDMETQMTIKDIQARHGIPVDGFVGALTQIVLYNETPSLEIPHLRKPGTLAVAPGASDVKPLPASQ